MNAYDRSVEEACNNSKNETNISKIAEMERGAMLRYLNMPIGEKNFVLSKFLRQHLTDCTHWHTITDLLWAFLDEMEQYI